MHSKADGLAAVADVHLYKVYIYVSGLGARICTYVYQNLNLLFCELSDGSQYVGLALTGVVPEAADQWRSEHDDPGFALDHNKIAVLVP